MDALKFNVYLNLNIHSKALLQKIIKHSRAKPTTDTSAIMVNVKAYGPIVCFIYNCCMYVFPPVALSQTEVSKVGKA